MDKKELKQWDDHLANERKELGIETFRNVNEDGKGTFRIEQDTGKCKLCGTETHYLLFLDKYNQGTGLCVCKKCLQECLDKIKED